MKDGKKVSKLFSKIGLEPDERVLLGFETHAKEAVIRREPAATATEDPKGIDSFKAAQPSEPLSSFFSDGKLLLVLTSKRLFTAETSWSGSPTKLDAEWQRGQVRKIAVNESDARQHLVIAFVDGSAVAVTGSPGSEAVAFADAWAEDEKQALDDPALTEKWEPLQVKI